MDFHGRKINDKFVAPLPIAEQARKFWDKIPEGGHVVKSLTVPRAKATKNQFGAIFGLMLAQAETELDARGYDTSFIFNLPDPTGIKIDKGLLKEYFYNACPMYLDGKRITLSRADTEQAAKFFTDVCSFLATQWGIIVPEPNPNWNNESVGNGLE